MYHYIFISVYVILINAFSRQQFENQKAGQVQLCLKVENVCILCISQISFLGVNMNKVALLSIIMDGIAVPWKPDP